MAFDSQPTNTESNVDWDALNKHVVDTAKTQDKPRSLVGIISGVIDLGEQKLPDAEMEFTGTAEQEQEEITKNSNTYFKDGEIVKGGQKVKARLKCWPQKNAQCLAFTVDFPQIMVNKGEYLGIEGSQPAPLRFILNGEFFNNGEIGLGRDYPIKWEKLDDGWSLKRNSIPYKLASASELIVDGKPFLPENLPDLVGRAAQFQIQVKINEKGYLQEKIKFSGVVPEGLPIPEIDPSCLYTVEFDKENDPVAVKQLRKSIVNTIKKAVNYPGNVIQAQIEGTSEGEPTKQAESSSEKKSEAPAKTPAPSDVEDPFADFDDNIPF